MLVILFRLLALCLTAPEKWKNFTGSPFGFLFHDSGYRESFLQVPKAHVSVKKLLIKHVWFTRRLLCGWLECPNFPGLFTLEATWHYTWNLTPKRWINPWARMEYSDDCILKNYISMILHFNFLKRPEVDGAKITMLEKNYMTWAPFANKT